MSGVTRDDIRAAVGSGMLTEAQAASLMALSEERAGLRARRSGLDEPFELFRGFNEIFIVVGLAILFLGWFGLTGLSLIEAIEIGFVSTLVYSALSMGAVALFARYFTLERRMVGPSNALVVFLAISAGQFGAGLSWAFDFEFVGTVGMAAASVAVFGTLYYALFRVPFTMAIIALGVYGAFFAVAAATAGNPDNWRQLFLLTGDGPFAYLTMVLGLVGFVIALRFDMSDPHRLTRTSAAGFYLHIVAAPAIVNTVALTLFSAGTVTAQLVLVAFILVMALMAIVIDRRSFLVAGIGYIVALSLTLVQGTNFLVIIAVGFVLIGLGSKWEAIRRSIMHVLPNFPGKNRLPPYDLLQKEIPA